MTIISDAALRVLPHCADVVARADKATIDAMAAYIGAKTKEQLIACMAFAIAKEFVAEWKRVEP